MVSDGSLINPFVQPYKITIRTIHSIFKKNHAIYDCSNMIKLYCHQRYTNSTFKCINKRYKLYLQKLLNLDFTYVGQVWVYLNAIRNTLD